MDKAIEVCDWYEHEYSECEEYIRQIAEDITNNHFNAGDIISMADFSGVCRFYIGWVLNEMEGEENELV